MPHLLRDLIREDPLAPDRERTLALAARRGDVHARDELVRSSLRLVALRVRAMGFGPAQVDDAMQEGALALLAAVDRFDPERGARLATFAWPRIAGALLRWRAANTGTVPLAPEEDPADPGPGVAEEVLGREPSEQVHALLAVLSVAEARTLWLRHGLDTDGRRRTWAQVGAHLGISASTARRRAGRAMSRARRALASMGDRAPHRGADPP